ncbi:serine/threonine protein kinase [Nonomuraea soli]|uniref:Serine/threonine protein kinase n=1 Tax=Nonomuraea soli TaxID=1032476 RepID=A0A7W0CG01_9ACTN|nr:serine/threonine-protein kinase [Nonomuraea soli]MBA2890416.1 serine/threonine protein kinase [Nonomuraea soli]
MVFPLEPDDPPQLGPYRLAGRLGEGGQGVVYLGFDGAGERVAVKLLSHGDRETRARLARELQALESVASFCTARVLDASVEHQRPWVVSEFVDGPSLAQRVYDKGPMRGGELERLVIGTATALAAIHAAGVVHRDFKPGNVLLGPDGPRVVDFGIARAEGASTMTSGLIGTPAYMAPEQINGSAASPASDVFAWAATMLYAATGSSPFGADTVPAVMQRVLFAEPDVSVFPPRLRGLLGAALSKDPTQRPPARDLMVALVNPGTSGPQPSFPPSQPGFPVSQPGGVHGGGAQGGPFAAAMASRPPGTTGPASPSAPTAPGSGRSRRGLVVSSVAIVAALAVLAGVVLWLNRGPATTLTTVVTPAPTGAAKSDPVPSQDDTGPGQDDTTPSQDTTPGQDDTTPPQRTRPPAQENAKIPERFAGTWSGQTTSTNPMNADGAVNTVVLTPGESTAQWSEKDATVDCTATIELVSVKGNTLTFSLGTSKGGCIPGTIWLDLEGDDLTYTYRDTPGMELVTETGKLRKQ